MEINQVQERNRIRFTIKGIIDETGAEELKLNFQKLNPSITPEVIFDFGQVDHIGSAGIGKLLLFYKEMAAADGSIYISNLSDDLYELFKTLKLDSIFTISQKSLK